MNNNHKYFLIGILYGLKKNYSNFKKFKEETKNKYHIKSFGIFGSVVKNCMNKNSDNDVVVNLTKLALFELIGIKQNLEEILKYPIDRVS